MDGHTEPDKNENRTPTPLEVQQSAEITALKARVEYLQSNNDDLRSEGIDNAMNRLVSSAVEKYVDIMDYVQEGDVESICEDAIGNYDFDDVIYDTLTGYNSELVADQCRDHCESEGYVSRDEVEGMVEDIATEALAAAHGDDIEDRLQRIEDFLSSWGA